MQAQEVLSLLKNTELFTHVPDEVLVLIPDQMAQFRLPAGSILFHEGQPGDTLYLIVEGQLEIRANGVEIAKRGPGECVGELALLDDWPRSATVTAKTDAFLLEFHRNDFHQLLTISQEVAGALLRILGQKLRADIHHRIKIDAEQKLERERRAKELEFERKLLANEQRARQGLEAKNAELQRTYAQLKRTQAELIQSEKMASLGQIAAGVAHEVNNPVNFIASSLPLLERNFKVVLRIFDELDKVYNLSLPELEPVLKQVDALAVKLDYEAARAAIPKLFSAMREGTFRTKEIVKSLQGFARSGGAGTAPVDLHVGLDATLMLLHHRFKRGITVHKDYGELPKVACKLGQINQVFMNLLQNAADAMNDKGEIFLTTRHVGQMVEIHVRDTGCGIPEAIATKIFDPFFTTKPVGKGMGLGLWIVYQIVVDGHGGKIDMESEVGKGTEFVVTLPIKAKMET